MVLEERLIMGGLVDPYDLAVYRFAEFILFASF